MRQVVHTAVPFGTPTAKTPIPGPVERVFATGKPQVTGLFYGPVANKHALGICTIQSLAALAVRAPD
jgi:hypothetical protein